jgi:hypothetical protein
VRLEIEGDLFRAFPDDQFVTERQFPTYNGGRIGFQAYNRGSSGSGIEAQVRFDGLTMWDIPDWIEFNAIKKKPRISPELLPHWCYQRERRDSNPRSPA